MTTFDSADVMPADVGYYVCVTCGDVFNDVHTLQSHQYEHDESGIVGVSAQSQETIADIAGEEIVISNLEETVETSILDDTEAPRRSDRKRKKSRRARSRSSSLSLEDEPLDKRKRQSDKGARSAHRGKLAKGQKGKKSASFSSPKASPKKEAPLFPGSNKQQKLTKKKTLKSTKQSSSSQGPSKKAAPRGRRANAAKNLNNDEPSDDDEDEDIDVGGEPNLNQEQESESADPNQNVANPAPLHLIGGSCIYCGVELKKPWDLVTHMVEQHEVQVASLDLGDTLDTTGELTCSFCNVLFTVPHDLYYHLLIGHAKKIFGRESNLDYCSIEMITVDQKRLTLKVRINRRGTDAQGNPQYQPGRVYSMIPGPNPGGYQLVATGGGAPMLYKPVVGSAGHPISLVPPHRRSLAEIPMEIPQELVLEAESQIRIHEKGFQCAQCYKVRDSREEAIGHVYKVHMCAALRRFQCPHCPKCYDNMKNLQTHVNACHAPQRMYSCPNCPMKYKYPGDLKRHLGKNVCDRYKAGGYPCPKCGMMWYHQSALASHQRQCDGMQ